MRRHNEKDIRVEKTRLLCGVFNENRVVKHEREALDALREWLKGVVHFLPMEPVCGYEMQDCESPTGEHVWSLGSTLQTRISCLAAQQTELSLMLGIPNRLQQLD
jgi:hypothetical protein